MGNKMKSKSGARKRFNVTGSGKVKFKRAKMRHIQAKQPQQVKRHLRKGGIMAECDAKVVRQLIPYK